MRRDTASKWLLVLLLFLPLGIGKISGQTGPADTLILPRLMQAPTIDGDLSEWKSLAHHDGVWDIFRVMHSPWYEPDRNRLTDHGGEPDLEKDLAARYYLAWDSTWLYFGAEVQDNVNDVIPHKPEAFRWFYKDCVAWFIEAPGDTVSENFGQGDNGFCFVADTSYPANGAWWRHGAPDTTYIEEPIPTEAVDYVIRVREGQSPGFTLEARVHMAQTLGRSDPNWRTPRTGDACRFMIVHTDPDGGDYGGHLLIYGKGDNDATWTPAVWGPPQIPLLRKPK